MTIIQIIIVSISLAMDAFAISISKGLSMKKVQDRSFFKKAIIIGAYFGLFQALMPAIGYALGIRFQDLVESVDHWFAFIMLSVIGINMIHGAFDKNKENVSDKVDFKTMIVLAIATSIDALSVGITFAFLRVNLLFSISCIGIITFILSVVGVKIGQKFGDNYESIAGIMGGVVLILIGIKILLSHIIIK